MISLGALAEGRWAGGLSRLEIEECLEFVLSMCSDRFVLCGSKAFIVELVEIMSARGLGQANVAHQASVPLFLRLGRRLKCLLACCTLHPRSFSMTTRIRILAPLPTTSRRHIRLSINTSQKSRNRKQLIARHYPMKTQTTFLIHQNADVIASTPAQPKLRGEATLRHH